MPAFSRHIAEVQHAGKTYRLTVINGDVKKIVLPYTRKQTLPNGKVIQMLCDREVNPWDKAYGFVAVAAIKAGVAERAVRLNFS